MLVINIPNRKKPTPPISYSYTPATPTLFTELNKRQRIVADQYKACPYAVGDKCVGVAATDKDTYGEVEVTHICRTYAELGKDYEWPANDNPLIVTAYSPKAGLFFCSTNFLKKV